MTETIEQMVSRIDERTKDTKQDVQDIKSLLAIKCVDDEKKFGERPTRREINKRIGIAIIILGLLLTSFGLGLKAVAYMESKYHANPKTELRGE